MENNDWVRQPQENEDSYMFSGQLLITSGARSLLSDEEVNYIITDVKEFVKQENGIDYLQVYQHSKTKQKLFFIDQLNRDMIAFGGYKPEHNHATILLPSEY